MDQETLRKEILEKVKQFSDLRTQQEFIPGKSKIPYAGRIYDNEEVVALVDSSLEFWLTAGKRCEQFEKEFATFFGTKYCSFVNSGSSANLLALTCFTSKALGEKRLKKGDKVITTAAGFPTTVNPIIQNGLIPRFVDIELGTYNTTPQAVEAAIDNKTKAIMLAHTLGNPYDAEKIAKIAKDHGLYFIEDCCDAVGSKIRGKGVGTFGNAATVSFYPAHHMTTGEGGAVLTSSPIYKKLIESFRDWGRDCWCPSGKDNTCGKRFDWKLGDLPHGYDHKYIYSNIGYNLKALDLQGAIGIAQLKKLPTFISKRQENYKHLLMRLSKFDSKIILPKVIEGAEISPFGFPITIKNEAGFSRDRIVNHLESKGIATRMLFGGNLVRQPAYLGEEYEIIGTLDNSDIVMNNTFWIGVYPGISREMIEYMANEIEQFISKI